MTTAQIIILPRRAPRPKPVERPQYPGGIDDIPFEPTPGGPLK